MRFPKALLFPEVCGYAGDIGEVVRMHEEKNRMRVQFNQGPSSLPVACVARRVDGAAPGSREASLSNGATEPFGTTEAVFVFAAQVHWEKEDEDIEKGDIGQVTSIRCKEVAGVDLRLLARG